MMLPLAWRYNEFKQNGKDYGLPSEVEIYDASHAEFRDVEKENFALLDLLALKPGETLIDFGCGTGTLALHAAQRGIKAQAVDVSLKMLDYARHKAAKAGIDTIAFRHAGFLSLEQADTTADAITTVFSFHHLTDFWKGLALKRMHAMLKPGGRLYIHDVVLTDDEPVKKIQAFIDKQAAAGGDFLKDDAEGHFRDEYTTYDWVMDGLLVRAGFKIETKALSEGVFATYLCSKKH